MAPQFEKAAQRLEPAIRLGKLNTDEEQELAARFGIRGIPTMILFRHGREIARQTGLLDATAIEAWAAGAAAG
jgi:thioredoxin 2